ncbi:MAG: hypothetical protein JNL28_03790 [Planctomycetes bacterium]|nr:hypothetical protein [Planctomycetota bacterium]
MFRSIALAALAALPFLVAAQPAVAPVCPNTIPHEPILMFDVNGGTLAGPVDMQLTVYNDGSARVCKTQSIFGTSDARFTTVTPLAARQLVGDVAALGAGTLCDLDDFTSDVPTSTLTILRDATDTRARTFSWTGPSGNYGLIEQRLYAFIHAHFPGF